MENKEIEELKDAAVRGGIEEQNELGDAYYCGRGVIQDYVLAARWYKKAAERGHVEAQYNLGSCYELGEGVEQDYKEAVRWYRKAAK